MGHRGSPESAITKDELAGAVVKIGAWKAPGTDGVPARLWKEVAGVLATRLRTLFDRCLSRGEFPVLWQEGRMVLLPKQGRSRTCLPPSGRCACWIRLASCWRGLWLSDSSRICPDVLPGYTTASLAFGRDGLQPMPSAVSAPSSRGPCGGVTWRWLYR
jgi:hypothetical protein